MGFRFGATSVWDFSTDNAGATPVFPWWNPTRFKEPRDKLLDGATIGETLPLKTKSRARQNKNYRVNKFVKDEESGAGAARTGYWQIPRMGPRTEQRITWIPVTLGT